MRFELTKGCPLPVFKTGAIDHSANLPTAIILRLDCVRVFGGYKTDAGPDDFRPIAQSRCAMAGAFCCARLSLPADLPGLGEDARFKCHVSSVTCHVANKSAAR